MFNSILVCGFIFVALCLLAYTVTEKTKEPQKRERRRNRSLKLTDYK